MVSGALYRRDCRARGDDQALDPRTRHEARRAAAAPKGLRDRRGGRETSGRRGPGAGSGAGAAARDEPRPRSPIVAAITWVTGHDAGGRTLRSAPGANRSSRMRRPGGRGPGRPGRAILPSREPGGGSEGTVPFGIMIVQFFFAAKANDLKVTKQTSRVGNEHFRPISNPFTGNSARRAPRHGPRTGQPRCSPARERAAGGAPGAAVAGKIRRAAAIIPDHRGITARANGLPGWRADAAASQVVIDHGKQRYWRVNFGRGQQRVAVRASGVRDRWSRRPVGR